MHIMSGVRGSSPFTWYWAKEQRAQPEPGPDCKSSCEVTHFHHHLRLGHFLDSTASQTVGTADPWTVKCSRQKSAGHPSQTELRKGEENLTG